MRSFCYKNYKLRFLRWKQTFQHVRCFYGMELQKVLCLSGRQTSEWSRDQAVSRYKRHARHTLCTASIIREKQRMREGDEAGIVRNCIHGYTKSTWWLTLDWLIRLTLLILGSSVSPSAIVLTHKPLHLLFTQLFQVEVTNLNPISHWVVIYH